MNIVGASGSAILVTGSSVAKFEIQFPSWSVNDQKNYYPYSVATNLQSSYYPRTFTRSSGLMSQSTLPSNDQFSDFYSAAITAPNGCVYFLPFRASGSMKINTTVSPEQITYVNSPNLTNVNNLKYVVGALASNGCIYAPPFGNDNGGWNQILKIDTNNDTMSVIESDGLVAYAYSSAITAPNGNIYCISARGGASTPVRVLKINPTNDTWTVFGSFPNVGSSNPQEQFKGAAISSNGVIYAAPYCASYILKVDTNTDTISTVANYFQPALSLRYVGAVLAPNNECIYLIPNQATGSLKIDPRTDQITYLNIPGSSNFGNSGGQLGPDGRIYCNGASKVIIDPFTDTISVTNLPYGGYPAALGFNGAFYSYNGNSRVIKSYDNRSYNEMDSNFVLSRYRNKPL